MGKKIPKRFKLKSKLVPRSFTKAFKGKGWKFDRIDGKTGQVVMVRLVEV